MRVRYHGFMRSRLNRILLLLAAAIVLIDAGWLLLGRFEIDWPRYGLLPILGLPLLAGAAYYDRQRSEPTLSPMLACAASSSVISGHWRSEGGQTFSVKSPAKKVQKTLSSND